MATVENKIIHFLTKKEKITYDVITALDLLHICHKDTPNSKGWLAIVCPFHDDKDFGNAYIHIDTGVIQCFNCGAKKPITNLLKEYHIDPLSIQQNKENDKPKKIKKEKTKSLENFYFVPVQFTLYLRQREFTDIFCKIFNIKLCVTYPYNDYIAIPVIDTKQNIFEYEFRKCSEYEYLQRLFYITDNTISLQELKKRFNDYCTENNIYLKNGKVYKNDTIMYSSLIEYLLFPKVLYLSNSQVKKTLFNIDNLNKQKPLYICEGTGSIPKLYQHISKNCTCTFGSNISDAQLQLLAQFKEIVVIPDNDLAGYKFVKLIYTYMRDKNISVYVIPCPYDDTDIEYVSYIQSANKIDCVKYLTNKFLYNFKK